MPVRASRVRTVVVAGDLTMDWNLAHSPAPEGGPVGWSTASHSRVSLQRGGAGLLADLASKVATAIQNPDEPIQILSCAEPEGTISPTDPRFYHSYAMWRRDADGKWRVGGYLGVDSTRLVDPCQGDAAYVSRAPADIVVIDDAALGFRSQPSHWPAALHAIDDSTWVVLKMASPVASGDLWQHLMKSHPERLIVVLTVDDLRQTDVQISRQLSWERTAQDVAWELVHNPHVNGLGRCAHAVVSFGTAGAILHSRENESARRCRLLFDSTAMEGQWERPGNGQMIGNTATLTSAIVRQLLLEPVDPDLVSAIRSGLGAMRHLYRIGYGSAEGTGDNFDVQFPLNEVVAAMHDQPAPLAEIDVQDPVRFLSGPQPGSSEESTPGLWTILSERHHDGLGPLSERIVIDGLDESLRDFPVGHIGHMTTVDRHEIESLRCIQSLMSEYCRHRQKRPLSIAVFGPPGSGKSFGVEQVANSVRPGEIRTLTFNLSQFDAPGELQGALHQVRDVGLSGKIPLVFWDEFDTPLDGQPLGWLRYFLAPMQDGAFQEGQITHPIGRCIFVFAGGTCPRLEEFGSDLTSEHERKTAKLPDFVSRLKGYLDVLGPNRQQGPHTHGDPHYIIRRAILLRSLIERSTPHLLTSVNGVQRLRIDPGVLRAFLQVSQFKHGIRSMESILAMSQLSGKASFQRSSLPAEHLLDLHVEGREFLALVQQISLTEDLAELLAEAAHDVWMDGKRRDGWTHGDTKCEQSKTHPWLQPYHQLPEAARAANRVTVRTIPQKLALAGYVMMPARSDEPALQFPGDDLERLAAFEHDLWMAGKLEAGYTPGPPTADDQRRHEYLVSWNEVPPHIQESDRDLVRGIPQILMRAGYAVVPLKQRTENR